MPPLHTGEEAAAESPAKLQIPLHPSSSRNPKACRSRQLSSPNVSSHETNKFLPCLALRPSKSNLQTKVSDRGNTQIFLYISLQRYTHFIHRYPPALWDVKCELGDCRPFIPYLTFIKPRAHEVITKPDGSMKLPARGWLRTCLRDRQSTERAELFSSLSLS